MYHALIVDDEFDIWFLLSSILRKYKFITNFVKDLNTAKKTLDKHAYTVIFLDNMLPDGLGIDFIKYVRAHSPSVKIIMITGHTEDSTRLKALKEGADYFIAKPFTAGTLSEILIECTTAGKNGVQDAGNY